MVMLGVKELKTEVLLELLNLPISVVPPQKVRILRTDFTPLKGTYATQKLEKGGYAYLRRVRVA